MGAVCGVVGGLMDSAEVRPAEKRATASNGRLKVFMSDYSIRPATWCPIKIGP
jgi:hypothetical protein